MRIPPCGNYGDIDDDGTVSTLDVTRVLDHVAGRTTLTDAEARRADVNSSGDVTLADALIIGKYVAGHEGYDTFPVCIEPAPVPGMPDPTPPETIPGDVYGDYPVTEENVKTALIPFAVAAVVAYVVIRIIWR